MVDEVRLLRLLRAITDDLAVLRSASSDGPERRQEHEYVRVDDRVVLLRLDDPGYLEEFAREVAVWLTRR